jgi:hypothetical protein
MAPFPWVLQASIFSMGSTMQKPQLFNFWMCSLVVGCSHIFVFMAGQTMTETETFLVSLSKGRALMMQDCLNGKLWEIKMADYQEIV